MYKKTHLLHSEMLLRLGLNSFIMILCHFGGVRTLVLCIFVGEDNGYESSIDNDDDISSDDDPETRRIEAEVRVKGHVIRVMIRD